MTEDVASFQTRKYLRFCGITNVTTVIELNTVKVVHNLLLLFGEVDRQTFLPDIFICFECMPRFEDRQAFYTMQYTVQYM